MKNALLAMLLVTSIGLGAICFWQSSRNRAAVEKTNEELAQTQTKLAEAEKTLKANAEAADRVASSERSSRAVQDTLVKTSQFAKEKEQEAAELQKKLAAAKTNSPNPLAGMAKMFKEPAMRDMIKTSQKAFMGPMIDKQYGALIKQLGLSDDQGAELKKLLTDKMLAGADQGMSLMSGDLTPEQRAEVGKQIKAQQDEYDAQIKTMLGDNYPAYEEYQKSAQERMQVGQFADQLSEDVALSSDQQNQLVQAMADARKNFKWTTDYTQQKNPADGNFAAMFSQEKLDTFQKESEQFAEQFLPEAQKILSPDQMKRFQAFQKQQLQMQMVGMKMAASMFGNQK